MTDELTYIPRGEFDRIRGAAGTDAQRAALFATCCRLNTLYMIACAGSGHIGSSFSSLDIVSWLYLNELHADNAGNAGIYFSSKGHDAPGLYSVLIALGLVPFERIHELRRLRGLAGHPDIETLPCAVTNTGSLGMGISKAKGMATANRLAGRKTPIFVLTGDGELQEGQFWESLVSAANRGMDEITAIVDHNKLQSDTLVTRTSDLGDLQAKFASFGWEVARCDGHDLRAVAAVLAHFKTVRDKPKILIADTIKGRGVSFMEHTAMESDAALYRFHSGAPDQDTYAKGVAELLDSANAQAGALGLGDFKILTSQRPQRPSLDGTQRMVAAYSKALVAHAAKNMRIVALDADLVLDTGLIPFKEQFPDRFIECGIAEMDMVSQAGGMALKGLLPVVHSFACFLSTRPNEQIYNNATERTKIVYVGSLAGLLPAGPGHSHQCVRDIASLAGIPGLTLIEPADESETALAVDYALNQAAHSTYLRLVSIPCRIPYTLPEGYLLRRGVGVTLVRGSDAVLFGYGPILLAQAFEAARLLQPRGVSLKVVNLPWLNCVDDNWLEREVRGFTKIFTLDNHYIAGGQGEMIAANLARLGIGTPVVNFGVEDVPKCGQNDEVLRAHRLDAQSLAEAIALRL